MRAKAKPVEIEQSDKPPVASSAPAARRPRRRRRSSREEFTGYLVRVKDWHYRSSFRANDPKIAAQDRAAS